MYRISVRVLQKPLKYNNFRKVQPNALITKRHLNIYEVGNKIRYLFSFTKNLGVATLKWIVVSFVLLSIFRYGLPQVEHKVRETSETYVGQLDEYNQMHGHGVMKYKNGDRYEGEFRSGKRHGTGIYTFLNGDVYSGPFVNDRREGQGTIVYFFGAAKHQNGGMYQGVWKSDRRTTNGLFTDEFGRPYSGSWDAQGKMVDEVGQLVDGVDNDKRVVATNSKLMQTGEEKPF